MLQTREQNQKWPTSGQIGYVTPTVWGAPIAPKQGTKLDMAHERQVGYMHPCCLGGPHFLSAMRNIGIGYTTLAI